MTPPVSLFSRRTTRHRHATLIETLLRGCLVVLPPSPPRFFLPFGALTCFFFGLVSLRFGPPPPSYCNFFHPCARPFRRAPARLCRMLFSTPTHVNKRELHHHRRRYNLHFLHSSCWLCSDTTLVYAYLCRHRSAAGRRPYVHRVMTAALFAAVPVQAGHHAIPHSPTIPQ